MAENIPVFVDQSVLLLVLLDKVLCIIIFYLLLVYSYVIYIS